MQIRFVSKGNVQAYAKAGNTERAALTLFGFEGVGEVSYEKELRGESVYFEEVAKLSKTTDGVVVSGCVTDTRGHRRRSAVVAEKGKLLGIADMLSVVDGEYASGAELRIYATGAGKMGVLVGEDLHFTEGVKALSLCGSDFIVCPYGVVAGELPSVLLRAHAYHFGTPIFLCGRGYAMAASAQGELLFSSPYSPVEASFSIKKEYHIIERRRKGTFRME